MKKLIQGVLCSSVLLGSSMGLMAKESVEKENKTAWFTESRFGMFVHWGLYSNPAGVWNGKKMRFRYSEWLQGQEKVPRDRYRQLMGEFNAEKFDAEEWITTAKAAGMKYFLITSKHHDGFALWNSQVSDYDIGSTPFGKNGRSPLTELVTACRKHGLKVGFYYSHWYDWEGTGGDVCKPLWKAKGYGRPSQEEFEKYWQGKALPQVAELMDLYNPDFFWFDTWTIRSKGMITESRRDELMNLVRSKNPNCLINSRIRAHGPGNVDFHSMGDNSYPEKALDTPWETSGTLNHSWAYHKLDFDWKSTSELLWNLVNCASKGGNYQLNVGPMGDGSFQKAATRRLKEIGSWMEVNGEAIYDTQKSPVGDVSWGGITCRETSDGMRIYLHVKDWPKNGKLSFPVLAGKISKAFVLENGQGLKAKKTDKEIVISGLLKSAPDERMSVIVVDIKK